MSVLRALAVGGLIMLGGPLLGWLLLAGFCNLPGILYSNVCGHNAFYWLPLFVALGVMICIYSLKWYSRRGSRTEAK